MIFVKSIIKVCDNSGARFVKCIRILKRKPKACAYIGDILIVSVKKAAPHKKIKKGSIQKAVVVRLVQNIRRTDGSRLKFFKSAVVLLLKQQLPIATRIFGPVFKELRSLKYFKIVSLSTLAL